MGGGLDVLLYFFLIPFIILALLALPPSSDSDPGSYGGTSSPLPSAVRVFIYIARVI